MKPILLDNQWKAKGEPDRVRLAARFLELENVNYGVVFGLVSCHFFENVWTLCIQRSDSTYLEQVRFVENKLPYVDGVGLPKPIEEFDAQWQLQTHGQVGRELVDDLQRLGAWDTMETPIDNHPFLDGSVLHILVKRPAIDLCIGRTYDGAIYQSGKTGHDLIDFCYQFTKKSPAQMKRKQFLKRLLSRLCIARRVG